MLHHLPPQLVITVLKGLPLAVLLPVFPYYLLILQQGAVQLPQPSPYGHTSA